MPDQDNAETSLTSEPTVRERHTDTPSKSEEYENGIKLRRMVADASINAVVQELSARREKLEKIKAAEASN